jgi:hypothetical protein
VRIPIAMSLGVLTLGSLVALAGDGLRPAAKPTTSTTPGPEAAGTTRGGPLVGSREDVSDEAREESALAFVRENHPELADLLEQLKAMKPDRYRRAIAELSQVYRSLSNLRRTDDRRYRVALEVWKAKSRAELLAAQLVGAPGAELEAQLRAAVEKQLAAELRQQRLERQNIAARLKKLDETIERMETKRDELVESRYQGLLKKGQRARRLGEGRSAPSRPAGARGENQE